MKNKWTRDEVVNFFRDMIVEWHSSTHLYNEDLAELLQSVKQALKQPRLSNRKSAFEFLWNKADCMHIAMVMLKIMEPNYPCIPDAFAELVCLLKNASQNGKLDDKWNLVFQKISAQSSALTFMYACFPTGNGSNAEAITKIACSIPARRNAARDSTWCDWSLNGLTPSKIREKWNYENPQDRVNVSNRSNGIETIKKAVKREKVRRGLCDDEILQGHLRMSPIVPD